MSIESLFTDLNELSKFQLTPAKGRIVYSAIRDKVLPVGKLLYYSLLNRNHLLVSWCLRFGADPNSYFQIDDIGSIHLLAFIQLEAPDQVISSICLVAGSHLRAPVFDPSCPPSSSQKSFPLQITVQQYLEELKLKVPKVDRPDLQLAAIYLDLPDQIIETPNLSLALSSYSQSTLESFIKRVPFEDLILYRAVEAAQHKVLDGEFPNYFQINLLILARQRGDKNSVEDLGNFLRYAQRRGLTLSPAQAKDFPNQSLSLFDQLVVQLKLPIGTKLELVAKKTKSQLVTAMFKRFQIDGFNYPDLIFGNYPSVDLIDDDGFVFDSDLFSELLEKKANLFTNKRLSNEKLLEVRQKRNAIRRLGLVNSFRVKSEKVSKVKQLGEIYGFTQWNSLTTEMMATFLEKEKLLIPIRRLPFDHQMETFCYCLHDLLKSHPTQSRSLFNKLKLKMMKS